jgi:hypothetical protein
MSAEPRVARARIYVSFADEDRARAMELVRWLNDSGWQVQADDRHAFPGDGRWSPPRRLDASDVILCVITPGWLVSPYCHKEYAHCAKQGQFVLPVLCELSDVNLLPPGIRALPYVDLRQGRMIDYLDLKRVLNHASAEIGRAATADDDAQADDPPRTPRYRRFVALLVAAVALVTIAAMLLRAR